MVNPSQNEQLPAQVNVQDTQNFGNVPAEGDNTGETRTFAQVCYMNGRPRSFVNRSMISSGTPDIRRQ